MVAAWGQYVGHMAQAFQSILEVDGKISPDSKLVMAPIFAFGMTCGAEMWFLRRYFRI